MTTPKQRTSKKNTSASNTSATNVSVANTSTANASQLIEPSDYSLDTEFNYYCALLQELIPNLRNSDEQEHANRWLTKLIEPSLNMRNLRDKRNRFLMMLSISLFSGHIQAPFNVAPAAKLPEISSLRRPKFSAPAWHVSATEWKDHLLLLTELYKKLKVPAFRKCQAHAKQCTGGKDARSTFLDRQFEFFLHLAKSYMHSLKSYPELRIACKWIEVLSQIDRNCCARAKGIRNDYLLALTSYLLQHQLMGPFRKLPLHPLKPLMETARKAAENKPVNRSDGLGINSGDEFLSQFPIPEEGAYAYISLSSDLFEKAGLLINS
ncbi:uncharacterized protein LOC134208667 [Armigeres subalbatus]|uniref:uncharacterized protein LOC134208667 n=1 Tax=Armigeres subalbatus TaxID=124917 RepID=UPI002ED20996